MKTSELLNDIKDLVLLSPSAEYYLRGYLSRLDGETLENDLDDEEEQI